MKMYAVNRGGPYGFDTKSEVFGLAVDPLKVPNCVLCLVEFLGRWMMWVRYDKNDVVDRDGKRWLK